MIEFKVTRMNASGTGTYVEELLFQDDRAATKWKERKNAERPGSIVAMEVSDDFRINESKYEF